MKFKVDLLFHPEENGTLRSFASAWHGRFFLIISMALAILYLNNWAFYAWNLKMLGIAILAAYLPKYRSYILLAGAFYSGLYLVSGHFGEGFLAANFLPALAVFMFAALVLSIAKKVGRRNVFAYPVTSLLFLLFLLIVLWQCCWLPQSVQNAFFIAALLLSCMKWFLAYGVNNITSKRPKPGTLVENLGMLFPFWGSTQTPFGKGWSYARKFESRTLDQLAKTQIKALHLMLVIVLLFFFGKFYSKFTANILDPFTYILKMVHGEHPSRLFSGLSLPVYFFGGLIGAFVWGNTIIVLARFAGFDLKQNMINPLF